MKISDLEIKDSDCDLESGFAYIAFIDGDETRYLQACLCLDTQNQKYLKEIDPQDSGMNDGLCGDCNQPLFEKYGVEECMTFFFNKARELMDIKIEMV